MIVNERELPFSNPFGTWTGREGRGGFVRESFWVSSVGVIPQSPPTEVPVLVPLPSGPPNHNVACQ